MIEKYVMMKKELIPRQIIIHWKEAPGIGTYLDMDPYPLEPTDNPGSEYWIIDNRGFTIELIQKVKGVVLYSGRNYSRSNVNILIDHPELPEKIREELKSTSYTIPIGDFLILLGEKVSIGGVMENVTLGFTGTLSDKRVYSPSDSRVQKAWLKEDLKSKKYPRTKKWQAGHRYIVMEHNEPQEIVYLGDWFISTDSPSFPLKPIYYGCGRKDSNINYLPYYPEPGKEIPQWSLVLYGENIDLPPADNLGEYLKEYIDGKNRYYLEAWVGETEKGFPIAYDLGEVYGTGLETFTEMRDNLLRWTLEKDPVVPADPSLPDRDVLYTPRTVSSLLSKAPVKVEELDWTIPGITGMLCNISEFPVPEIKDQALKKALWEREKTLIRNSFINEMLLVYKSKRWRSGEATTDIESMEAFIEMNRKHVKYLELTALGTPRTFRDGRIRYITEVLGIPREDLTTWITETFEETASIIMKELEDEEKNKNS